MMIDKTLLGIVFLPLGIISMGMAALWQMYVMLTETHTLNRFSERRLVWVVAALFLSFSLAVYLVCPNAHKKGIVFFLLGGSGVTMYFLAKLWLPFQ